MRTRTLLLAVAILLVAIQLVPVARDNPPVEEEVQAPDAVRSILRRSCYDCHSNETRWPWYSRVAPVSWLVASDVHEARDHLNFSTWSRYDAKKRAHRLREVREEVEEGKMPLPMYLLLHPGARLGEAERSALRGWVQQAVGDVEDGDEGGEEGHEH